MSAAETEAADESPRTLLVEGAEGADGVQCFNRDLSHLAFQEAGVHERQDLQRLLRDQIQGVGQTVMVLAEEFGTRRAYGASSPVVCAMASWMTSEQAVLLIQAGGEGGVGASRPQ